MCHGGSSREVQSWEWGDFKGNMALECSEPQMGLPVMKTAQICSVRRLAETWQCARQWRLRGCANGLGGWGLDGSESLTSRQCHTRRFLGKTPSGELPPDSSQGGFSHPLGLRLSRTLHRPDGAAPSFPPLPQGAQHLPKWPPSHLHPRRPGSGLRARNSIGTTSSHLESWGKSIP